MKNRPSRAVMLLACTSVFAISMASCARNTMQSVVPRGTATETSQSAVVDSGPSDSAPLTTQSATRALGISSNEKNLRGARYFVVQGSKGKTYFPKNARFLRTAKALIVYAYNTRFIFPIDVTLKLHKFAYANGQSVHKHVRDIDKTKFRLVQRPITDAVVSGGIPVRQTYESCAGCVVVARLRRKSAATTPQSSRRVAAGAAPPTTGRHVLDDYGWGPGDDPFYYDPWGYDPYSGGDPGYTDPGNTGTEDVGNYTNPDGTDIAYMPPNTPPPDPMPCIPGTFGCDAEDPWPDDPSDPFLDPSFFNYWNNLILPPGSLNAYITWSVPSAIYMTQVTPKPGYILEFHLGFKNKVQSEHYFCNAIYPNTEPAAIDVATPGAPGANFIFINQVRGNYFPPSGKLTCMGQTPDFTTIVQVGSGYLINVVI